MPSQRIREDCNRFARIVEKFGLVHVARAIMTLVAFVPVLKWGLKVNRSLVPFFSDIPGSLVWTALSVSVGGLIISWFVGYQIAGAGIQTTKSGRQLFAKIWFFR